MAKTVLNLYLNEGEFRDDLCNKLDRIEKGLVLIKSNYIVRTAQGASGSFDILARDRYKNFVIIEVKRSNAVARQALHELAKYISLFILERKVDQQKIRCFVVSTDWHELDVVLPYFMQSVQVNVKGFLVEPIKDDWVVTPRDLPPVDVLPKFCPDVRFICGDSNEAIKNAIQNVKVKLETLTGVRAAVILTQGGENASECKAILCVWRIADAQLDEVKCLTGKSDSEGGYYQGWGAESDLLEWIIETSGLPVFFFREYAIATPEKISNLLARFPAEEILRLGDWEDDDLVNDLQEVCRCLLATDVSGLTHRSHRYEFHSSSSKKTGKSWGYTAAAFNSFIDYVLHWGQEVKTFLETVELNDDVTFYATDSKNFFYRIFQAGQHGGATLSQFLIVVEREGAEIRRLFGGWEWDGATCPSDPQAEIEAVYGTLDWCRLSLFSSVDKARYENAHLRHGFLPYVVEHDYQKKPPAGFVYLIAQHIGKFDLARDLNSFVEKNHIYCSQVSKIFDQIAAGPPEN